MTSRTELETWLVGVTANDGMLAGLRVHAGWVAAGPTSGRGTRMHVRLYYGSDATAGFPDVETSASLLEAEEAAVAAIGDMAVFVAVITAPGFRDLIFYTDNPHDVEGAFSDLGDTAKMHQLQVDQDSDPSWAHYRALFSEAVLADQDRRRLEHVTRDDADGPPTRTVTHSFVFSEQGEAETTVDAFQTAGIVAVLNPDGHVDPDDFHIVQVSEVEVLTQTEMAKSRDALSAFAVSCEGTYKGWELAGTTDGPASDAPGEGSVEEQLG